MAEFIEKCVVGGGGERNHDLVPVDNDSLVATIKVVAYVAFEMDKESIVEHAVLINILEGKMSSSRFDAWSLTLTCKV